MRAPRLTRPSLRPGIFICRACRLGHPAATRRQLSSSASKVTEDMSPVPRKGNVNLKSRTLISVTGPDATKFLNGVITSTFKGDAPIYTAFLSAQGRILYDVFIYPHHEPQHKEDGFLIEVGALRAIDLQKHIRRFRLRSKFETRLVSDDEMQVRYTWDDSDPNPTNLSRLALIDPRAPGLGVRTLVQPDEAALPVVHDEEDYIIRRYLYGVAEGPTEIIPESALPAETNLDVAGAVDWHKGCYVGQELTIRTRHRGVVRKRILPCMIYDEGSPPPETLQYEERKEGAVRAEDVPTEANISAPGVGRSKSAGKWLAGMGNVGLALCRLESIARPDQVNSMSLGPVKVKAFLPEWLRKGMEVQSPSSPNAVGQ